MSQRKIDELFSSSKKRSIMKTKTDEFDDIFENPSSNKRRRVNQQSNDVFDFPTPSIDSKTNLKKKRSAIFEDEEENQTIDDLFNNDTRKKLRRSMKTEPTQDVFDLFPTQSTIKKPKKKIEMFFDPTDLESDQQKDYTQIKPVLITGGQWLSKSAETKSTVESTEIPTDERNLMHIQYVPLIIDEKVLPKSQSKAIKGKSFQKQSVVTDSSILRKENLESCYNALLEDVNKARIGSNNPSTKSIVSTDEEQIFDFFDLSTRRKKR